MLKKAGYEVCGIARSVPEALAIIEKEKPALALVDIHLKGPATGIGLAGVLKEKNIAFIYVSANYDQETLMKAKATQPYGFIVKPFKESDLLVTLEIAQFRHEHSLEAALRKEEQLQADLDKIIQTKDSWQGKMLRIARALQPFLSFDYLMAYTHSGTKAGQLMSYLRVAFDEYQFIGQEEFRTIAKLEAREDSKLLPEDQPAQQRAFFTGGRFKELTEKDATIKRIAETFRLKSLLVLPVRMANGACFNFAFYSRRPDAYDPEQLMLPDRLWRPLSAALQNMTEVDATPHVQSGKQQEEPLPKQKNKPAAGFDGIIGKSHLLLSVLDHISQVAPVNTSVLILGESGTGKERIARSIHQLSKRSTQPFVKINCTALPSNLIESELFGHEKGAFTGAIEKRIGKFEQADKGTIFLDEIGDMPHELQAKLLRVLQEKEIERIGGRSTIKVDVRVIAATNLNLEKAVAAGRFRLDLYYRLNVFPITLPPLRDRKEDIPLLIGHFISIYNHKLEKNIKGISAKGLNEAMAYHWPGNIRELENLVERSILLSKDEELKELAVPRQETAGGVAGNTASGNGFKTMDENERDHIITALRNCKGKISGAGGAAELLNLPPTTLTSKMKKFGIRRDGIGK
jgi:transcriptional regulator with GAF, ATPase, and Fis domain